MDKAKAAVSNFISKSGHHDTTVHETVAPAVTHEDVKVHEHENVMTAVDKEVHQDHYHRTVQPVQDREVLPEQHHANLGAVQHREFDNRDRDHTTRTLEADQAQFRDKSVTHDTTHSQAAAAAIGGEHKHHHIHETIQPVIQKETIQPHVVHTTVPIHEVHHQSAKHHEASTLPPVTMDQFKAKGGVLGGREERYDGFEGQPKNIGGTLGSIGHNKHDSHHHHDSAERERLEHEGQYGNSGHAGLGERALEKEQLREGNSGYGNDGLNQTTSQTAKKPSLMDKLNPKIDANGDGKAGFMK